MMLRYERHGSSSKKCSFRKRRLCQMSRPRHISSKITQFCWKMLLCHVLSTWAVYIYDWVPKSLLNVGKCERSASVLRPKMCYGTDQLCFQTTNALTAPLAKYRGLWLCSGGE
jgi:hypothetical protein